MAKAAVLLLLVMAPMLSLLPSSLAVTGQLNFCVADLALPPTPGGYPCKPQPLVTSGDFYSRALAQPGPTIQPFNAALSVGFVQTLPGLNGLHIGASRVDIFPGGVVPVHTHPQATELLIVTEGSLVAGFISGATSTVYSKTVSKGEIFVFPRGLLHFQYNIGNTTAVAFSAYSSANPGLQIVDYALFKSTLPPEIVTKITFINTAEVVRLEASFALSPLL